MSTDYEDFVESSLGNALRMAVERVLLAADELRCERDALRAQLDALNAWGIDARNMLRCYFDDAHAEGWANTRAAIEDLIAAYPAADAPVAGPTMEPDAHGASPVSAERNEQPAGAGSDFHAPTFEATMAALRHEVFGEARHAPDRVRERVQAAMAAQREYR